MSAVVLGFALPVLVAIGVVVFAGGIVKGVAGFGYAIAGTAVLAGVLSPAVAVVVMIVPMLVANLTLFRELDEGELSRCTRRFWPFLVPAAVGTAVGMTLLTRIPTAPLSLGLGLFTLGYVALTQDRVVVPGKQAVADVCFRPGDLAKAGVGFMSGFIFGASNAAVQVVAYLDSLDLDRSTFAGVLSLLLVGISTVRVGLAWVLGLYGGSGVLAVSVLAAGPGLAGVVAGRRLRTRIPEPYRAVVALALLTVIGLKLTTDGALAL